MLMMQILSGGASRGKLHAELRRSLSSRTAASAITSLFVPDGRCCLAAESPKALARADALVIAVEDAIADALAHELALALGVGSSPLQSS